MTSLLPDLTSSRAIPHSKAAMAQTQEPTPPDNFKQEDDRRRERPGSHDNERDDDEDANEDLQGDDGDPNLGNSSSEGAARKRRRSRKGLDKKFSCQAEGCGKSYSRAEHLYRHQLNHTPKQVYRCDYPGCDRQFVRLDLRNRHRDRHTAKGSALNRKDSILSQVSPLAETRPQFGGPDASSPETLGPGSGYGPGRANQVQFQSPKDAHGNPYAVVANTPPTRYSNNNMHPNGADYMRQEQQGYGHGPRQRPPQQPGSVPQRPNVQANVGPFGIVSPATNQHAYPIQMSITPQPASPFVSQSNFPPFTLPPSDFSTPSSGTAAREAPQTYTPPVSGNYPEHDAHQASGEMMLLQDGSMPNTMPVFGTDSILNKSPYVNMPEDFVTFLFNNPQRDGSPISQHMVPPAGYTHYSETYASPYSVPYYGAESSQMGYFPSAPQQVMAVTNLLDQNPPESIISDEKSAEVYEFIRERFHENGHARVEAQRDAILEGDRSDEKHMLSRKMMQAYIGSYWLHFSDQIPILHKPTFSPEKTPNLLLIAMMTIGAACLDKAHGQKVTKAGAELSNFLAWHLRWRIFMDPNCWPPAKLWVFQSLLLLELYEKMYSTRELHERAHIHHATTITLMRRGRSLIGKSALDSPPNSKEDKQNGSRHSSASGVNTPDEWWSCWITNESTRRAAFAAFVIDSIHATMFGHSTVMVAHEMRLPLPCDEKLWKATSSAEVGRIETNLYASGVKPISFLEALKRTLSNAEVKTNSFGRMILMAGLLSVSWHMNQRDLQVNSLGQGVSHALGGRDKWRGTLTRAFDSWKSDFDKSLSGSGEASADPYAYGSKTHDEASTVFESRIVLHHLAHMAMHVDIVDCQIYARAKRLLGRAIGTQDLHGAQRRMKDTWAPSAKARDAAYYALKFLTSVLLSEGPSAGGGTPQPNGHGQADEPYSARDDLLLNRPWVLYFSALVVWCYGHALEGPCPRAAVPASRQEQVRQMREYLAKYGSVQSPDALRTMKGINNNSALLLVLEATFQVSRWELLHEGAMLLNNCIQLNAGATV